jgi:hypothetical protein
MSVFVHDASHAVRSPGDLPGASPIRGAASAHLPALTTSVLAWAGNDHGRAADPGRARRDTDAQDTGSCTGRGLIG